MDPGHWIMLANTIHQICLKDEADGIVTQATDILDETAYVFESYNSYL